MYIYIYTSHIYIYISTYIVYVYTYIVCIYILYNYVPSTINHNSSSSFGIKFGFKRSTQNSTVCPSAHSSLVFDSSCERCDLRVAKVLGEKTVES